MTYKEFKRHVFTIYNETFTGADNSPIEYGIQRARFEEKKLQRLIVLADQTDFSTAKRKVAGWHRQLERVQQIRERLELRKSEMVPVIPSVRTGLDRAASISLTQSRRARPLMRAQ
jgi:hypothetical protein